MPPKSSNALWLAVAAVLSAPSGATAQSPVPQEPGGHALQASLYGLDPYDVALLFEDEELEEGSLRAALKGGRTWVNFRLRHEEVDADAFGKKAHATTLRSVLGYETGRYESISGTLEFDDIHFVAYDAYNGGGHFRPDRPTVADPQIAGLNQAHVTWHGEDGALAKVGRQKIELNNERFVGDVGWRQNDQTFDAALYQNPALGPVALTGAYLRAANTITGGKSNLDGLALDVSKEFEDLGKACVYALAVEFDTGVDASTSTVGAFFDGNMPLSDDLDLLFRLEFANQTDYGDSNLDVDANYTRFELGAKMNGWSARVGSETLGGSDGGDASFQTPLATKHAFNGWADVFLTTPAAGLVDTWFEAGTKVSEVDIKGLFHQFTADDDIAADQFGTEVDLVATKKLTDYSTAGVKLASYSADDFGSDVTKAWIWVTYSF